MNALMPGMPPAPGRFSTTICCFQPCESFSAISRDAMSGAVPGGNGTVRRTGFVGQSCACAAFTHSASNAAIVMALNSLTDIAPLLIDQFGDQLARSHHAGVGSDHHLRRVRIGAHRGVLRLDDDLVLAERDLERLAQPLG